ncbi:hypothetical protein AWC02_05285 [Mycolicibacter engbaekii]|uniref:DUF732 domain-containing protein n=2 Tax=Mycolicibacter engbaekii TaxID=188915 RepID=A0A1X1TZI2_9MYCO|nr:hypothetical protein AWC02_05285 [Mycolicibacter engbaekii]
MDPGYCGARQDPLDCVPYVGPTPPPPNRAEAAYLNNVRGHYPGDDATLLKIGRGTCIMLRGGTSTDYVVHDVAAHMKITAAAADQVVDAAIANICPELTVGADGVARPGR